MNHTIDDVSFQHSILTGCIKAAVCTKNRNWNNDEYEEGVIKPYNRLKELLESVEQDTGKPGKDITEEAVNLLKQIFETKHVDPGEQEMRLREIYSYDNQASSSA
jgi:[acyl-carrier-protein] S-malonyltransferase